MNKKHIKNPEENKSQISMWKIKKGENIMSTATLEKFNIGDTKKHYTDINNKVLNGAEVITYNEKQKGKKAEVSHIKTEILDNICDKYLVFHPKVVLDKELNIWTVSVDEINMYGEGTSPSAAIDDLLDCLIDYEQIYLEKIDLMTKVQDLQTQLFMRKIIRCERDRQKLRKVMNLENVEGEVRSR